MRRTILYLMNTRVVEWPLSPMELTLLLLTNSIVGVFLLIYFSYIWELLIPKGYLLDLYFKVLLFLYFHFPYFSLFFRRVLCFKGFYFKVVRGWVTHFLISHFSISVLILLCYFCCIFSSLNKVSTPIYR